MRTFTLEEAQSLLPVLESLLKRAIEGRRSAQTVESGLNEVAQRIYFAGGMRVDTVEIARQRAESDAHLKRVQESIAEIDAIGVQVKDLEAGLLDFPCRVDDEIVLLCWRMGETAIEHWHTRNPGFRGASPWMIASGAAPLPAEDPTSFASQSHLTPQASAAFSIERKWFWRRLFSRLAVPALGTRPGGGQKVPAGATLETECCCGLSRK